MSRESERMRRGFTLVELLIVIAVIAVLVGLLLVAMGSARRNAERAQANRLLATVGTAVDAFKQDFGWTPPLLISNDESGADTQALDNGYPMHVVPDAVYRYVGGPATGPQEDYRAALSHARYHSSVSLAMYLVGAGDLNGDEVEIYDQPGTEIEETNWDDGKDGPGIRQPGVLDKSWGGGADRRQQVPVSAGDPNNPTRLRAAVAPPRGRVYGPYLDPGLLGDALARRDDGMFELRDTFGYPIRYYKGFPTRDVVNNELDLSVVPIELRSFESVDSMMDGDTAAAYDLDRNLLSSEYVLLSAGSEAREVFTGRESDIYERWIGPKDDGLVPPYGDIVRSGSNRLYRLQMEWGEVADRDALNQTLEGGGMENLFWALRSNVRSIQ